MAPPPTSPPSSPPSELGEISPRRPLLRRWRRPTLLEMMMGEGFQRILLQEAELMIQRVVRQELENGLNNFITPVPRQLVGVAQHARYHIKFLNKICDHLHTFNKIEGEAGSDVGIALFDNDKKVFVISGPLSSIKVEIVVLDGDFNNDDRETWSEEEFNRRIALPRDNRGHLLKGKRFIKLNNGITSLGDIAFTDNSSSRKTKKFRLGVRYAQSAPNGERIQEGITEPLRVKDRRVKSSQKHHIPSLDDEVWRLKYIRNDGEFHKSLQTLDIKTVQDFLRYYNLDKDKLRKILGRGMSETYWKEIVKHARECDPGDKLYSYSVRENSTVVPVVLFFNSIYHLVGVKFGDCYTTIDNLDTSQQDLVESWKNLAYRNINGMQFDHRMINGHPMPLLSSDVTSLPGSSSLPPHISNFQIRNSASEACFGTQPYSLGIESPEQSRTTVKDVSFERDNSLVLTLPMETAPTEDNFSPQIMECLLANYDEQATPVCSQNQVEPSPFVESLRVQSTFSRMSSFDPSFCEGLIQTFINNLSASSGDETSHSFSRMSNLDPSFSQGMIQTPINNLPASSGGETSRSIAPLSLPPRWVKLLAPIKWVQFTKKRRARILIHQTLVATV